MISEYAILMLFVAVNFVAPFYQPTLSPDVVVYLTSLVLLYVSFLFWGNLCSVTTILYCLTSFYFLIRWKLRVSYLAFANLFLCHVVISHTLGGAGGLTLSMLFAPEPYANVMSMVSDTAFIAYGFMIVGVPIFLLVRLFMYIGRNSSRSGTG
jgi:hypothetical protein